MSFLLVAGLIQSVGAAARGAAQDVDDLAERVRDVKEEITTITAGLTGGSVNGETTGIVTTDELKDALDELRREFRR